jgi:hypothetical protein
MVLCVARQLLRKRDQFLTAERLFASLFCHSPL